ncbi:type IV secretion system protein [Bifidobacterium longum]|uniref:type IV secretion system protein n=1 Tax=Bifidobacterium longum TaxID=216816 RepID=UPI0009878211|nr:type IV secretion system protein [Bifidobacterium longum]
MGDIVEAVLQKLFPWMLDPMGKALQGMMVGAFSSTAGSVSYAEWNVAITAANRIGWVMGFVNMLICAVGAVHAAVKASPAESVKSFAMAVLAWPLTAICVSVMITCEGIVSLLSARILAVGADTTKGRGMESMVSAMFKKILEQASVLHSLTMLLVYLVLFVGVFLLCCMLAARTLCLVLLAAVAPLPVMSAGWKATRPAMRRWLSAVVGVMLAKPLAALVITVGSALMTSQTTSGVGEGSFWDLLVGVAAIYMACYSPKMIMPVVQFLGDDRSMGMQQAASQAGRNALVTAAQLTRQVVTAAAGVATGGAAAAGVQLPGMAQGGLAALTGQWGQVGEQAGKMLAGSKADGKDKDDGGGARDSGAHAADPSKDDGYEPPVSAPPGPDGSAIPAPDGASSAGTAPGGAGGDGGRGVAGLDGSDGADGIGGEGGLGGAGGEGRTGSSGAPGSPGDPGPAGMPGPDAVPAPPVSPQSPSGPVLA